MLNGLQDGGLGNLVKDDTRGLLLIESQHLTQVPADGFSLAVFIGCEPDLLGLLGLLLQFGHYLFLLFRYLVYRIEIVLVYAEFFLL